MASNKWKIGSALLGITGTLAVAASELLLYFTSNGHARLDFLMGDFNSTEGEKIRQREMGLNKIWLNSQDTKEFYITSSDGLKLRALYLPAPGDETKIAFCIHGVQSTGEDSYAIHAKYFYEHGISSFIIDQRATGKSEGKYVTYGDRESEDCKLWLDFIYEHFGADARVFIYGSSMGSSTALLINNYELPSNVEYIVADCGYASVKEQIKFTLSFAKLPTGLFYWLYKTACRVHRVYNPDTVDIIGAVRKCRLPVIFIHGDADDVVPTDNVHELYDACGSEDKSLIITKGYGHVQNFVLSEEVRKTTIAKIL